MVTARIALPAPSMSLTRLYLSFVIAAIAVMLAGIAHAGGSATFVAGDNLSDPGAKSVRSRVEFDSARRVRVQADRVAGYLVVRDDAAYAVAEINGRPMVFDYAQAMATLGGLARSLAPPSLVTDGRFVNLTGPGRIETIAGLTGRVWLLTTVDKAGRERQDELVLTPDPRARELSDALLATGRIVARALPELDPQASERLALELRNRGSGLLRVGNSFLLERLDPATPPATRFALPSAPMTVPDLGGLLGGVR